MRKKIFISFILIILVLGVITVVLVSKRNDDILPVQEYSNEDEIGEDTEIEIQEDIQEVDDVNTNEDNKDVDADISIKKTNEESKQTEKNKSSESAKTSTTNKNTTTSQSNQTNNGSKSNSSISSNNTNASNNSTTSNSSTKEQSNNTNQTLIAQENKQEETTKKEKSIYDYEFDIDKIRSELISIGKSRGLKHIIEDDGVKRTPNNSSWSNPITASKNFQGSNLERSLKDYVRSMPDLIEAYGGPKIEYFTIYVQNNGNGSYTFYFLY